MSTYESIQALPGPAYCHT